MNEKAIKVIDAMGGTTVLAKAMKSTTSTVHNWRIIGIPESRMEHIKLLAKTKRIKLPCE